ncbi:hypothetical protein HRbin15_02625 [bacterium HR15]|nr:hypothetical protein HRbin15_02625 [bacterium HR15]
MRTRGGVRFGAILLLIVVLAGLAGVGSWWWRERNREYLLRFQPKVGDTMRYFFEMNASAQGQSVQMTAFLTQKVLKVQPNGLLTIETRIDSGTMKMNGASMAMPSMPPFVRTYRPNGQSVQAGRTANPIGEITEVGYPNKPIKIGDTWSDRQATRNGSALEAQFQLVGKERVRNRETLKIAVTIRDVSDPNNPVTMMSGHQWVDLNNGVPVKVDMQFHQVRTPMVGTMPMQGSIKMVLLP